MKVFKLSSVTFGLVEKVNYYVLHNRNVEALFGCIMQNDKQFLLFRTQLKGILYCKKLNMIGCAQVMII